MPLKVTKPKGRRYWYVVGTVAGIRIRESAATTSKTVAEALKVKRETELQQRRIYGPGAVATFAEAVNMYLDNGGEDRFLAPILEQFGTRRLADLTQTDLDAGARELYPSAKPSTLNRQAYTPFIAVMNEAAINRLCPYQKWRRPRGHDARTKFRWLWPYEFDALHNEMSERIKPLGEFMVGTGARLSEAQNLLWKDVDLPGGQAWLWETKTANPRRIEIPPRVVATMANLEGRKGFCFGEPQSMRTGFMAAVRRSGIDRCTPHDLRHTFASWHYSANRDRLRLKALGGWKSDQVDRYCHLAPHGLQDELVKFRWDFSGRTKADSSVSGLRQL